MQWIIMKKGINYMTMIFIYMGLESTSISQCMTKNVKTIQLTGSLFNVCKIMKDNKIGCIVIVNESMILLEQ